ncbi:MAG: hypothetical protein JJ913_02690 [Rhizobiaceae bacterium]|nr:hypothetical protein [Rhizobiaceae bacterium]
MFRTTDIILIAAMIGAAGLTFKVKHDAEMKLDEVRRLETEIRTEEDTIDVLRADWSFLTQPERLQRLVDAYNAELKLNPVEPDQIGSMDRIGQTLRTVTEIAAEQAPETDAIADAIKTGAVSQ